MHDDFSLDAYDYTLPPENIAQHPSSQRDLSKLLVLDTLSGAIDHKQFSDVTDLFKSGDVLTLNDTRVFPARLLGRKETGGRAEVFLLEFPKERPQKTSSSTAFARTTALIRSSKSPGTGSTIHIGYHLGCTVVKKLDSGKVEVELAYPAHRPLEEVLGEHGTVPLPPYIDRTDGMLAEDTQRYQTVYARATGAVAAPTAGLHFTPQLLEALRAKGVDIVFLTLHVGYGTFAPVRALDIKDHRIHSEYVCVPESTALRINRARENKKKVWAVGTTTVRALEFASDSSGTIAPVSDWCDLYIMPGYRFQVIDNLITNFHLPKSSLLFLVAALCGRSMLLKCYSEAIARNYRFYSYGDAMAILS